MKNMTVERIPYSQEYREIECFLDNKKSPSETNADEPNSPIIILADEAENGH